MSRRVGGTLARDRHGWQLMALLVVAIVVPSACVLWFMTEAATNQAEAARRAVADAYRGQLRVVRNRVNTYWQTRATDLESILTGVAVRDFHALVTAGAADSVVVLGREATPIYPSLAGQTDDARQHGMAESIAARESQAVVHGLMRAGLTSSAIDTINRRFLSGPVARGSDPEGRLIAADEQLLLINLLPRSDPRRATAIERLIALLNDYSTDSVPSAQRVFLMVQMQSLDGGPPAARFPTLGAERLAIAFLETERPRREAVALRPTASPDVWQLSLPGGRAVALFRTATVQRAMRPLLDEQASTSVAIVVTPPGAASLEESMAIGSAVPGWEVSLAMPDQSAVVAARGRRNAYLSVALVAIGLMAAAVALFGGAARRQARLASLKSDLVSTVSHELKTPLASMRLLVDTLLEDAELDPIKAREYLQLMAVENARLSRLIDNFLTFSRLDRQRYQFSFQPTDPSEVVHQTLMALPEGRRGDHGPVVEVAPSLPSIVADRDALVTALLNLIDNAYKYTPSNARILVRAFVEGGSVVFAVQDNGIGIAPREQKRIFRRFYRVDERLAQQTSGSGLGLSIVQAIVRAHGGSVRVESRPAEGSTFALHVPCPPAGAPV